MEGGLIPFLAFWGKACTQDRLSNAKSSNNIIQPLLQLNTALSVRIYVLRVIWIFSLQWCRRFAPPSWLRLDRTHCRSADSAQAQVSEVSAPSAPDGAKRDLLWGLLSAELLLPRLPTALPLRVRNHKLKIVLRNIWSNEKDGAYASAMLAMRKRWGFAGWALRAIGINSKQASEDK